MRKENDLFLVVLALILFITLSFGTGDVTGVLFLFGAFHLISTLLYFKKNTSSFQTSRLITALIIIISAIKRENVDYTLLCVIIMSVFFVFENKLLKIVNTKREIRNGFRTLDLNNKSQHIIFARLVIFTNSLSLI
ncbi:hypothetical protein, partial [Photobacterium sanctipauli]